MLQQVSVLAMLGICSLDDFRYRKIHTNVIICFMVEGLLCSIFLSRVSIVNIMASMIPGIAVLLLSYISHEAVGKGDGLLLITAGIFLGISSILAVLTYAAFLSGCSALFLFFVRKKSRKYEMPFIPYLLAAFIIHLLLIK